MHLLKILQICQDFELIFAYMFKLELNGSSYIHMSCVPTRLHITYYRLQSVA